MTSFIPPMLPTLVDGAPQGDDWLNELKHDGYRTQLHPNLGEAVLSREMGMTGASSIGWFSIALMN